MPPRRSTFSYTWCIVLALILSLIGIRLSANVSRTQAQDDSFVFTAHGDLGAYDDPNTLAGLSAIAEVATTNFDTGFSDVFSIVASSSPTPEPTPRATATRTPAATPSPTETVPASLTPMPSPDGDATTVSFVPVADAYVYSEKPAANYGTSAKLRTDGNPDTRSFMIFDVQGIDGTVTRAILQIYANSASIAGYDVNRVGDSSWTELAITYSTAPPVEEIIGSSGPIVAATWTTIDVTDLVAGNGLLPLALTSTDNRAISLSSREGENPPELIITFTGHTQGGAQAPTPPPTNTPVPTDTLTPSDTPMPTSTPIPTNTSAPTGTPMPANTPTPTNSPTGTPTPTSVPQGSESTAGFQPTSPFYGTFFYLWYQQPNTDGAWNYWNDYGKSPPRSWFSHYLPDYRVGVFDPATELYSSVNYDVFKWQVSKLAEARQEVAIASWWGPGTKEDAALQTIVNTYMLRADNPYPDLRWCIYYEQEGYADEDVDTLVANLEYIKNTVAGSRAYLKVDGKPVIFVYAGANDTPGTMTQRWKQANNRLDNYFCLVLKIYPGFSADVNQPDSWHEYAPARRGDIYGSYSAFVSPGFWLDDGRSSPRLLRSLSEFETAVIRMVNADVTWKLVETWNEWGEGTAVEPGDQVVETSDGEKVPDPNGVEFGNAYIDILSAHLPPLESETRPADAGTAALAPAAPQALTDDLQNANADYTDIRQTSE
jgi:cell division septation protein DedD